LNYVYPTDAAGMRRGSQEKTGFRQHPDLPVGNTCSLVIGQRYLPEPIMYTVE